MSPIKPPRVKSERLFPNTPATSERIVSLSLLDATTINFAPTSAVWLFERPTVATSIKLVDHLRHSFRIALDAYPQWCGRVGAITTVKPPQSNGQNSTFQAQNRRFGRAYVHYGTPRDPGVEFVQAASTLVLDDICPCSRPVAWNVQAFHLQDLVSSTTLVNALQPAILDDTGLLPPALAVQVTQLACGSFTISIRSTHPMADITALVQLMKDWGWVSREVLAGTAKPNITSHTKSVFDPQLLDSLAAGDINSGRPDAALIQQAEDLPLHRYDWWAPSPGGPKPTVPKPFQEQDLAPVGKPMPWSEWDSKAPVSHYVIHFTREQIASISKQAMGASSTPSTVRISQHDAILAHVWSCINRARNLQNDPNPVHCDLVYGVRPALKLGEGFIGSPIIMINAKMKGIDMAPAAKPSANSIAETSASNLNPVARRIRETIDAVSRPDALAAHLHSVAYEKSPQRIWQAFLGKRHILVTSWARAGVYDIDFGLCHGSSGIRYVQSVMPSLDGIVMIQEAPPSDDWDVSTSKSWTDTGVDVSIHICAGDMDRLIEDPLLFPLVQ